MRPEPQAPPAEMPQDLAESVACNTTTRLSGWMGHLSPERQVREMGRKHSPHNCEACREAQANR